MTKTFRLKNLDCANCAAKLERAVGKLDGVTSARVNFFALKLNVEIDDGRYDETLADIRKVCKKVEPDMELIG